MENKDFIEKGIKEKLYNVNNVNQAIQYLRNRGIDPNMFYKYNMFIDDTKGVKRLVIPVYEKGNPCNYIARAIENTNQAKVINGKGTQKILNGDYIQKDPQDGQDTIYICEGWTDTLSLESCGIKSISLNGTNNTNKLIELLEKNKDTAKKYKYVLAFDNDQAGHTATKNLKLELEKTNYNVSILEIPQGINDINDWCVYVNDREKFKEVIENTSQKNNFFYIANQLVEDCYQYKNHSQINTGFKLLDKELNGMKAGLYCLGAISSLGKTTFCTQIMTQLAKQNHNVIFFSMEQSEFELTIKNLSRETKVLSNENKTNRELSNDMIISNILNSSENQDRTFMQAFEKYKEIAPKIKIISGNFGTTVEDIRKEIENYINITKIKPIVFIDYLQIIQPPKQNMTDKQITDYNITTLKKISRDYNITIFVICSLNRDNYSKYIDFTSFKESGAIEYSSDILLRLQLSGIEEVTHLKTENERREKTKILKNANPREIELVCLKNRYGKANFKVNLHFNPQCSYFEDYI